jgi:hypothetical protein
MVRNIQKHEFWVKWSGLDAFIAKIPAQLHFGELER